jgi:hypothetical protein
MKYAIGLGSGAMIMPQSFMKIGAGIPKLMGVGGRGHTQRHSMVIL